MKRLIVILSAVLLLLLLPDANLFAPQAVPTYSEPDRHLHPSDIDTPYYTEKESPDITYQIEKIVLHSDKDQDGIPDLDDIVLGARIYAESKPKYVDKYYDDAYPPENVGVCTDMIWKAFRYAGYELKAMVDEDIKEHRGNYPSISKPDPNIDFRRVVNLHAFFKSHAQKLTLELVPYDAENLKQWQAGDIVTFDNPDHIAILSDKRRTDGIPYLIHCVEPYAREADEILEKMPGITGHFRFPK